MAENNIDDDSIVIEAMQKYGGSFVQALGRAAAHADMINLAKIKNTWPEYWQEYLEFGKKNPV